MAHKTLVSGTAYEIGGGKVLVGGTGYSIDKGRTKVGGTGYDISFITGTPIGSLAVGTSVYMNVGGERTEFLIVNQGRPSSDIYDTSCDGTWLLTKDIYTDDEVWDSLYNDYRNSDIHAYLNNTFLGLFDSDIQSVIKQVKIPYHNDKGNSGSISSGAYGLSTKIFLLAGREVGLSYYTNYPADGVRLSYFTDNSKRIATYNGTADYWCLRSPGLSVYDTVWCVSATGNTVGEYKVKIYHQIRPALVLPSETTVDGNFNVIA